MSIAWSLLNISPEGPHLKALKHYFCDSPWGKKSQNTQALLTEPNRSPDLRATDQIDHVCLESKAVSTEDSSIAKGTEAGPLSSVFRVEGAISSLMVAPSPSWLTKAQSDFIKCPTLLAAIQPHRPSGMPVCSTWSPLVTSFPRRKYKVKPDCPKNFGTSGRVKC